MQMAERLQIEDLWFERFITGQEIERIVAQLGREINRHYVSALPLFLPVLNGSYLFMADLTRALDRAHRMEFIKYQSYAGTASTGSLTPRIGLDESVIKGQDLLIVEDIVDSGRTVAELRKLLREMGATKVRCVTAFFKPGAHEYGPAPEFVGREIPDDFVVGYGMDYNGWGRHWRGLYRRVDV